MASAAIKDSFGRGSHEVRCFGLIMWGYGKRRIEEDELRP